MSSYSGTSYNYTINMETLVRSRTSELQSFCTREEIEMALKTYLRADSDAKRFRLDDLSKLCKARNLVVDELLQNPELVKQVPAREEVEGMLLDVLHDIYTKMPSSEDYMTRIVRKLAREYKADTVRTAILKKFVLGGGLNWKTYRTSEIISWAYGRLSETEKEQYELADDAGKLSIAVEKLDDSIFSSEHLNIKLDKRDQLILMVRRMNSLINEYDIRDNNDNPVELKDFNVSNETLEGINALLNNINVRRIGNESVLGKLQAIINALNDNVVQLSDLDVFWTNLEDDFSAQMKETLYRNKKGKIDKAASLYKTDKRDALARKGKDWELLKLCDDFAEGRFRNNGGKTRAFLYYFAMMFGMSVCMNESVDTYDHDKKTVTNNGVEYPDMVSYLFEDYYSDNLIRFLDDAYDDPKYVTGFEKEPSGEGINYKNFAEAIYLYYLYRKDLNLTPGQRIDKAEAKIEQCTSKGKKNRKQDVPGEVLDIDEISVSKNTRFYRRAYIREMIDLDEDSLVEFVLENYSVIALDEKSGVRIMVSSDEYTAHEIALECMEELETEYESSSLNATYLAMDEYAEEVDVNSYLEEARYTGNILLNWKLSKMMRERYCLRDDSDEPLKDEAGELRIPDGEKSFFRMIDILEDRLSAEFRWIGARKTRFLAVLLQTLYHYSSDGNPIKMESLCKLLKEKDITIDGFMILDGVDILQKAGFDISREVDKKKSLLSLGSRSYSDEGLNNIISLVSRKHLPIRTIQASLSELLQDKIDYGKRISRSTFVSIYSSFYLSLLEDTQGIESFVDLYEDFTSAINPMLEEARFQTFSDKNILDMYVLVSLYMYLVVNGKER